MRALLVSTYDLGRQPFGLASPAAWLRRAGVETDCVDTSRDRLTDQQIAAASLIGFYLPMHTATRLASGTIARVRRVNPAATLVAYGLYAPLNEAWLRERGMQHVLGPESEADIADLATQIQAGAPPRSPAVARTLPRLAFIQPDRASLPSLARYASLTMSDGTTRIMGSTDATRGCKHLCRHCPIVPVYQGQFRVVPVDVVLADIRSQVEAGAQHISFGDPDFFNGPTHAVRIVDAMHREFPHLTFDATIKIEHLLRHAELLPRLEATGCVFITSAVESIDDRVLLHLRKGHTRADFVRATAICRTAGIALSPTFVPFTPWTTVGGYVELLDVLDELELAGQVSPIQLAIRLLVTAGSPLLELDDVARVVGEYDAASLIWPWRHSDPCVDELQGEIMRLVGARAGGARDDAFEAILARTREVAGLPARTRAVRAVSAVPYVDEPWYCCAEPVAEDLRLV
jgi:radical SAM superfamily enzyme YgiQ (UPF0313 family)